MKELIKEVKARLHNLEKEIIPLSLPYTQVKDARINEAKIILKMIKQHSIKQQAEKEELVNLVEKALFHYHEDKMKQKELIQKYKDGK